MGWGAVLLAAVLRASARLGPTTRPPQKKFAAGVGAGDSTSQPHRRQQRMRSAILGRAFRRTIPTGWVVDRRDSKANHDIRIARFGPNLQQESAAQLGSTRKKPIRGVRHQTPALRAKDNFRRRRRGISAARKSNAGNVFDTSFDAKWGELNLCFGR